MNFENCTVCLSPVIRYIAKHSKAAFLTLPACRWCDLRPPLSIWISSVFMNGNSCLKLSLQHSLRPHHPIMFHMEDYMYFVKPGGNVLILNQQAIIKSGTQVSFSPSSNHPVNHHLPRSQSLQGYLRENTQVSSRAIWLFKLLLSGKLLKRSILFVL